ncbi:hypothetical protein [Azospirillum argentinense]
MPNFETSQKTKVWRLSTAKHLKKWLPHKSKLRHRLETCRKGRRCASGACPTCRRQVRRWFVGQALDMLEEIGARMPHLLTTPIFAVTIIDRQDQRPQGELHTFEMIAMIRRIRKLFERAGLGPVVILGGVDFSFNIDDTGLDRWDPHWCPHLHLVVIGATRKALKKALAPHFIADRTVKRPLYIKEVKGTGADFVRKSSYCLKNVFNKIPRFIGAATGKEHNKKYSLIREPAAELASYLDLYQLTDRLFLRNIRRHGWRLVLTLKPDTQVMSG